jgi:hypothetical protein
MNLKVLSKINREQWLKTRREVGVMSTHVRVKGNGKGKGSYKRNKTLTTD